MTDVPTFMFYTATVAMIVVSIVLIALLMALTMVFRKIYRILHHLEQEGKRLGESVRPLRSAANILSQTLLRLVSRMVEPKRRSRDY